MKSALHESVEERVDFSILRIIMYQYQYLPLSNNFQVILLLLHQLLHLSSSSPFGKKLLTAFHVILFPKYTSLRCLHSMHLLTHAGELDRRECRCFLLHWLQVYNLIYIYILYEIILVVNKKTYARYDASVAKWQTKDIHHTSTLANKRYSHFNSDCGSIHRRDTNLTTAESKTIFIPLWLFYGPHMWPIKLEVQH